MALGTIFRALYRNFGPWQLAAVETERQLVRYAIGAAIPLLLWGRPNGETALVGAVLYHYYYSALEMVAAWLLSPVFFILRQGGSLVFLPFFNT